MWVAFDRICIFLTYLNTKLMSMLDICVEKQGIKNKNKSY